MLRNRGKRGYFQNYFWVSIFGHFLDIYKCPFFKTAPTFIFTFVTEGKEKNIYFKMMSIYGHIFQNKNKCYFSIILSMATTLETFFTIWEILVCCSSFVPPDMEFITILMYWSFFLESDCVQPGCSFFHS
jgi:hypothetical protein